MVLITISGYENSSWKIATMEGNAQKNDTKYITVAYQSSQLAFYNWRLLIIYMGK
jgi:hypothetical protein